MPTLIGRSGSKSARRWKSARIKSKERRYNNDMNEQNYNAAVEAVKQELIETAAEMGLDVDYYKSEILTDEYVKSLHSDIAEKLLQTA